MCWIRCYSTVQAPDFQVHGFSISVCFLSGVDASIHFLLIILISHRLDWCSMLVDTRHF